METEVTLCHCRSATLTRGHEPGCIHYGAEMFIEKLMTQLDKDQPKWYIAWATSRELEQFSEESVKACESENGQMLTPGMAHRIAENIGRATGRLRNSVANRLFHRILNASLAAGIMKEL